VPFHDADDYHSPENVQKMSGGSPLDDGDRIPWLESLAREMRHWAQSGGAVLACSALKVSYRKILMTGCSDLLWVYLRASRDTISERLRERPEHFMPFSLVDSQLEALEEPGPEAIILDATLSPSVLVAQIQEQIARWLDDRNKDTEDP
jgi:6-phosphogluconate dehydrogenase